MAGAAIGWHLTKCSCAVSETPFLVLGERPEILRKRKAGLYQPFVAWCRSMRLKAAVASYSEYSYADSTRAGPDMPPGPVAVRTTCRSSSSMLVATSARMPLSEYSDFQFPAAGPVVSAWMHTLPPAVMWPVYILKRGRTTRRKSGLRGNSGGNLTSITTLPGSTARAERSALSRRPLALSSSKWLSCSRVPESTPVKPMTAAVQRAFDFGLSGHRNGGGASASDLRESGPIQLKLKLRRIGARREYSGQKRLFRGVVLG